MRRPRLRSHPAVRSPLPLGKDGSIGQANAQAATQQHARQQASANAQAEQTAQGDLSALQGAADFSSEQASMSSDVSTIQNDLQTEKNDAAQGPGSDCYGISGTVDYYVTGTIEYDVNGSFQYDLNQLTTAISVARGDITTLNNDPSWLSASGLPRAIGRIRCHRLGTAGHQPGQRGQ